MPKLASDCAVPFTFDECQKMDTSGVVIAVKARDAVHFIESCHPHTTRSPAIALCPLIFRIQSQYPKLKASNQPCAGRLSQRLCLFPLCTPFSLLQLLWI